MMHTTRPSAGDHTAQVTYLTTDSTWSIDCTTCGQQLLSAALPTDPIAWMQAAQHHECMAKYYDDDDREWIASLQEKSGR